MAQVAPTSAPEAGSRILLIEDDCDVVSAVREALGTERITLDTVADGGVALMRAVEPHYSLLIVDRMLPTLQGLQIVESLRKAHCSTPVLFLTALGGLDDRVEGLEAGGDDYLVKPFEAAELVARVRALIRRSRQGKSPAIRIADLEIDLMQRTVKRGGVPIRLQHREFNLLATLAEHSGEVLTRSMLLERVWGFHFDPHTGVVETHVSRLRSKVDKPFGRPLIHTRRGSGYTLSDEADNLA